MTPPATVANHFRKTETSEEGNVRNTANIAADIAES